MKRGLGLRFESLRNVLPNNVVDIFEMARSGLCVIEREERPQSLECDFCAFAILGNVDSTTNFWLEHAINSPLCIHLLTTIGIVGVCQLRESANADNSVLRLMEQNLLEFFIKPKIENATEFNIMSFKTESGIEFCLPHNLDMTEVAVRLHSLHNMPVDQQGIHTLSDLAKAGFFYKSTKSHDDGSYNLHEYEFPLYCYYCNSEVYNWRTARNPWRAHSMVNKKCFHNIITKGEDFLLPENLSSDEAIGSFKRSREETDVGGERHVPKRQYVGQHRFGNTQQMSLVNGPGRNKNMPVLQHRAGMVMQQGHAEHMDVQNNISMRPSGISGDQRRCCICNRTIGVSDMVISKCCDGLVCRECTLIDPRKCPNCSEVLVS